MEKSAFHCVVHGEREVSKEGASVRPLISEGH